MALRILHIIAGMDPKLGGVSQAVRTMIKGLSAQDVYSEVVSLDGPDAHFLSAAAFPIYALGPGKGPWCYSSKKVPWLVQNLGRFDKVIIHGLWLYQGYAVRKAMKIVRQGKRGELPENLPEVYCMPHGMLDPYFQNTSGRKLKALRNRFFWKLIESKVVNEANGLLFTCNEELRLARQPFRPYLPKKEVVVGLGVEAPPSFTPAMQKAFIKKCLGIHSSPYLLFLSRINEKKAVDLLIEAYHIISGRTGRTGIRLPKLVIAGPGLETVYGGKMKQLAYESFKLQNLVFFPGMLTGEAKWGAYYGCDAFVLPSHQENFGIAVVEALACTKPVLISNQINIWEEIRSGGGGMVAEDTLKGTLELLDRWCRLAGDERKKFGDQARQTFERKFAVEISAKQLITALL